MGIYTEQNYISEASDENEASESKDGDSESGLEDNYYKNNEEQAIFQDWN